MKRFIISVGMAAAILLASQVALAQGKGKAAGPKTTKVTGTTHGPAIKPATGGSHAKTTATSKVNGPKVKSTTTTAKVTGPKAKSTTTTTAKVNGPKAKSTTTTAKVKEPKSTTTTAKAKEPKSTTTTAKAKEPKTTTTPATTPTPTPTTGTLTKVQEKLQSNTKLASKLQSRLPEGTDLMKAAEGFGNLGKFVSAVNVSHNLGIDFTKLKTAIVDDGMSLGQAIQAERRADIDPTSVATRAEIDADVLIRSTEDTPSSPTTQTASRKAEPKSKGTR